MLRRKIDNFLKYWYRKNEKALLVTGARQVGKTFSIDSFGKSNFKNYSSINFAYQNNLIDIFAGFLSVTEFLNKVELVCKISMNRESSLIFFDEIQLLYQRREELKRLGNLPPNSQDLISIIKGAIKNSKFRFVLSGSLLGVNVKDIFLPPNGYMDIYEMMPLDFEEFLWAKGVEDHLIDELKQSFNKLEKIDDGINIIYLNLFKEYILVGGMPEAVNSYISNNSLFECFSIHKQIYNFYLLDITRYIKDNDREKLLIREVFKRIPSELSKPNKRFISSSVLDRNELKHRNLEDEFLWLTNAGIAIPVYNVSNPIIPLVISSSRKTLKLFLNDVGLLTSSLLNSNVALKILNNETTINFGEIYENVAAQELISHGFKDKLFYYNSKKAGEIDFLIEYNNDVVPIEIKSGKPTNLKTYNHNALNNVLKTYPINKAFVFGETNIEIIDDKIIQFPIYMIDFIKDNY